MGKRNDIRAAFHGLLTEGVPLVETRVFSGETKNIPAGVLPAINLATGPESSEYVTFSGPRGIDHEFTLEVEIYAYGENGVSVEDLLDPILEQVKASLDPHPKLGGLILKKELVDTVYNKAVDAQSPTAMLSASFEILYRSYDKGALITGDNRLLRSEEIDKTPPWHSPACEVLKDATLAPNNTLSAEFIRALDVREDNRFLYSEEIDRRPFWVHDNASVEGDKTISPDGNLTAEYILPEDMRPVFENYLLYSEEIDNLVIWPSFHLDISADNTISPDGNLTAEYLKALPLSITGENHLLYSEEIDQTPPWLTLLTFILGDNTISPDGNLTAEYLLAEDTRPVLENHLLYSEEIDNLVIWPSFHLDISADNTISPDGNLTAEYLLAVGTPVGDENRFLYSQEYERNLPWVPFNLGIERADPFPLAPDTSTTARYFLALSLPVGDENRFLYSEEIDHLIWIKDGVEITSDVDVPVSPEGTTTVEYLLAEDMRPENHLLYSEEIGRYPQWVADTLDISADNTISPDGNLTAEYLLPPDIRIHPENWLLRSEEIDLAPWDASNLDISADNTISPDETNTAEYLLAKEPLDLTGVIRSPNPTVNGKFGHSISCFEGWMAIGAPGEARVYIYEWDGQEWGLHQTLTGSGIFGNSVHLEWYSGTTILGLSVSGQSLAVLYSAPIGELFTEAISWGNNLFAGFNRQCFISTKSNGNTTGIGRSSDTIDWYDPGRGEESSGPAQRIGQAGSHVLASNWGEGYITAWHGRYQEADLSNWNMATPNWEQLYITNGEASYPITAPVRAFSFGKDNIYTLRIANWGFAKTGTPVPHGLTLGSISGAHPYNIEGKLKEGETDKDTGAYWVVASAPDNDNGVAKVFNYDSTTGLVLEDTITPRDFGGSNVQGFIGTALCGNKLYYSIMNGDFLANNEGAVLSANLAPPPEDEFIRSPNGEAGGKFGHSVEIMGDIMAVGAPGEGDRGQVYIYHWNEGDWDLFQTLDIPGILTTGAEFGFSLGLGQLNGNTLIGLAVGAPGHDSNRGAVFRFEASGVTGTFSLVGTITSTTVRRVGIGVLCGERAWGGGGNLGSTSGYWAVQTRTSATGGWSGTDQGAGGSGTNLGISGWATNGMGFSPSSSFSGSTIARRVQNSVGNPGFGTVTFAGTVFPGMSLDGHGGPSGITNFGFYLTDTRLHAFNVTGTTSFNSDALYVHGLTWPSTPVSGIYKVAGKPFLQGSTDIFAVVVGVPDKTVEAPAVGEGQFYFYASEVFTPLGAISAPEPGYENARAFTGFSIRLNELYFSVMSGTFISENEGAIFKAVFDIAKIKNKGKI